ncbi:twin-arginine translocase subunit TatC [Kribbella sp. NBC_00382]|uniref:twin-arginine translocase subunit TatC n=1 Tax=Kribbella sp. NBC_00382 TaxID=2975967 RepID=UPI002E22779E
MALDQLDSVEETGDGRMSLRGHITELRNRLLIGVLAIVVCTVAAWFVYDEAFKLLTAPFQESVRQLGPKRGDTTPILTLPGVGDALTLRIKVSALIGVVLAGPIWLYQLWAFIAPGLHRSEKKWAMLFASIATPLFAGGMAVAYWTLPKGIAILISFTPDAVQNLIEIPHYLDFVIRTMLVFGIAFLIPLVVVLLNMLGLVPASALSRFRPYIILVIFVFAAVATPSGDPFTMCLLAIPMCLLFFIAEVICRINDKRRSRAALEV